MRTLIFVILFLFQSISKGDSLPNFIVVEQSADETFYFTHPVQKSETLYSISKTYSVSIEDIKRMNMMTSNLLSPGQLIKIPLRTDLLDMKRKEGETGIEAYYYVKPKETLFRIARVYFKQRMGLIREANGIEDNNLEIGQRLLVGYYIPAKRKTKTDVAQRTTIQVDEKIIQKPTKKLPDDVLIDANGSVTLKTTKEELKTQPEKETSWQKESGTAFWDKKDYSSEGFFVLHRKAKKGTYIELHNPMSERTIKAKVVGSFPYNLYPPEVDVVVSPAIAKQLLVLDSKFYVEMKYSAE